MSNPSVTNGTPPAAIVTGPVRAHLLRWARERQPRETGGLLWGRRPDTSTWRVDGVRELRDRAATPRRYRADPREVWRYLAAPMEGQGTVIGMFHTHPSADPTPSSVDSRTMPAGFLHAIVGREDRGWSIRAFHREAPDAPVEEVRVHPDGRRVRTDRRRAAKGDR